MAACALAGWLVYITYCSFNAGHHWQHAFDVAQYVFNNVSSLSQQTGVYRASSGLLPNLCNGNTLNLNNDSGFVCFSC